jgi:uncharacterized membrane protein YphA (DoxX/SURF4 family)
MLNTFPSLLSYAILVPFVFRICLVIFLFQITTGLKHKAAFASYFKENKYPLANIIPWTLQILSGVSAILLILGLFTQIASLLAAFTLLTVGNANKFAHTFKHSESAFFFAALVSFSLLLLGAGAFAFDLPL